MFRHKHKLAGILQLLAFMPISLFPITIPLPRENTAPSANHQEGYLMAQHEIPLTDRWPNKWVNQVFADNILLGLAYLRGDPIEQKVDWTQVEKPFHFEFKLDPSQTFAFHDDVLPKYEGKIEKTSPAHFTGQEGFKSDGYLFGDGVCHLASLIYWAAKDAGLEAEAPTNHNFAHIADIPKQFGVSIYSNPNTKGSNAMQNLYVTNNQNKPVTFEFAYVDNTVKVSIVENN